VLIGSLTSEITAYIEIRHLYTRPVPHPNRAVRWPELANELRYLRNAGFTLDPWI
jgi:hypothetical protein